VADGPAPDRPVVSDTTPLITLAGLGLLDLLPRLYGAIWVPEAVRAEYDAGRRGTEPPLDALSWVVVKPVRVEHPALSALGPGEGAAVSLALGSRARAVLLDEKLGRRVASELGLPVVGTLAVLLRAKRQGMLAAVGPVLDAMAAQGRYVSGRLRRDVLRAAGETV
jgi:predicted nucleic acid-binding protein